MPTTPPPSHYINIDMEAQAQLKPKPNHADIGVASQKCGIMHDKFLKSELQPSGSEFVATKNFMTLIQFFNIL